MEHVLPLAEGSSSGLPAHELPIRTTTKSGTADRDKADLKTVRKELRASFKPSRAWTEDANDEFIPRKTLTNILTHKTIQSLLHQKPKSSLVNLDDIIGEKKRIKIFAILLLIKKTQHIGHLIQQGVSDDDLPLGQDRLKTCLRLEDRPVKDFLSYQYEVNVPVWDFSAHEIHEEHYNRRQQIPFLRKHRVSSGGQGIVWRVEIHRDHYETKTQSVG